MTWKNIRPDDPEWRKDIVEGTLGTIEGFPDPETKRQVLLKILLDVGPGKTKKREVCQPCNPGNLTKSSELKAKRAGVAASEVPPAKKAKKEDDKKGPPGWCMLTSQEGEVKVESSFKELLLDNAAETRTHFLKARVNVALESLCNVLPTYCKKDLVVVQRRNAKGVWNSELWTNRAFEPEELLFAPMSTQLKDTHIMKELNAVVGIPKHGRGSHPGNQSLAFCGRGKYLIGKEGSIDEAQHKGVLFFLVGRTSDESEVTMSLEQTSLEMGVTVNLPLSKKKKSLTGGAELLQSTSSQWGKEELPSIPVLINKKALKAHVRLMAKQVGARAQERTNKTCN